MHLLLLKGFAKASAKSHAEREEFVMCVQCYVNMHITEDKNVPGKWQFPVSDDRKTVIPVTTTNSLVHLFVNALDGMICLILPDEEEDTHATKWIQAMSYYRPMCVSAHSRSEFMEADIECFQDLVDDFYENWVDLHGTNI